MTSPALSRRSFLQASAASLAGAALGPAARSQQQAEPQARPTQFQIACMTLPYSAFSLERALTGLQTSGYRFVALGHTHTESSGQRVAILPPEAPPERARELGQRCRDRGLEPLMIFSGVYPEAPNHLEVMRSRIRQASAASIPQILTFGNTRGGDRARWVEHFRQLGPIARDAGVLIVLKPHGGLTARAMMAAEIVREVADEGIKVNEDAGNVMDYLKLSAADTLADMQRAVPEVRSFCIKDHRQWPRDEDCGPGLGEIDHYRLLQPVAFTGRAMPLCCENISAPLLPRPTAPEGVDALARRAREFLETVVQGLQTPMRRP